MLTDEPCLEISTAIEVADPQVSVPTGTSLYANANVVDEPSDIVNNDGAAFALASGNWIALADDGRSIVFDGSTPPVRSCRVRIGQPLIVHVPVVVFVSVMLA